MMKPASAKDPLKMKIVNSEITMCEIIIDKELLIACPKSSAVGLRTQRWQKGCT